MAGHALLSGILVLFRAEPPLYRRPPQDARGPDARVIAGLALPALPSPAMKPL
jgi:hypothetical protein